MVVLRKIKGSTLMETLVATVLIVLLFTMASLLLNSIFASSISGGKNQQLTTHLQQLEYRYKNGIIAIPYYEELEEWNIVLDTENFGATTYLVLEATNNKTKQQLKTYSTLAD